MISVVHWGKYYPPDQGGIENVTATVARGAAAAGHKVTVVCFSGNRAPSMQMVDGVRVLRERQAAFVASQPLGWGYLMSALREGRHADLVHLHTPNMLGALAATMLGKTPKLLVHWHSDVLRKGSLGTFLRPLERAMLGRADRIICTSKAYADGSSVLRPFLDKVAAVPIGVPDVSARDTDVRPLHIDLERKVAGRRIVLAVGRLVPYKGFDVLVDAAALLPDDVAVVIVGNGPLKSALRARIDRLGLQGKVQLTGRLTDLALDSLYRRAHLFCLPSVERSEAFGVVLVEAMAYGLPIVATCITGSGVPWVNEHHVSGLNVTVGDVQELASACRLILASSELRERLATGARRRFEEHFTESRANARMLEEYVRVVGRRH